MMKKHKSKTNIMNNDKQTQKFISLIKKQKNKNQLCQKSTGKHGINTKKLQTKKVYPQKTTNMHTKTKSYLQKMTIILPQENLKNQIQSYSATHRRKSASVFPQRVQSRQSKRGSVASNKSSKHKKTDNLKENDKNYLNLQEVQENLNQQIISTLSKKPIKKLQSQKKLSLNLNFKPKIQYLTNQPPMTNVQKSKNYKQFENKMSRYLDSKDIFSRKASLQRSNHSKQSKKSSSQKKISEKEIKLKNEKSTGKMKNKQRQNLLEIYQFYKKTFDINFNNCFKRGKNKTKIDKNSENSSKSALKPFYSSIVVNRHQNSTDKNQLKPFYQTNNQTKISVSGVLNENDQNIKSKRSGSVSICQKQNENKIKFHKSSLINSQSNINSDTSTKDNLFYWKVDQQKIDKKNIDDKKSKKSFKDLIVFNEKIDQNFSIKQEIPSQNFQCHKMTQRKEKSNQLSKISIGESNIQVLKWSHLQQKNFRKDEKSSNQNKEKSLEHQKFVFDKISIQKEPQNQMKNFEIRQLNFANKPVQIFPYFQQNLDVTNLIKKRSKQDEIGNLDDLSSISLINDRKNGISQNPFSASPKRGQIFLQIDDIDFQL